MSDALIEGLKAHRERQEVERLVTGDTWEERGADIRTTANIYAHVLPTLAEDTATTMDAILRPLATAVEEADTEAI